MTLDQQLFFASLSAYLIAALALLINLFARSRLSAHIGGAAAVLGAVAQFAELAARYAATGIWPLTNLYGSLSLFAALATVIFVVFAVRYDAWYIGGPVMLIGAGFLSYAATWNEGAMPAVPALQSYWIKIHVPLVVASYAAFLVAACVALIYIFKARAEALLKPTEPLPPPARSSSIIRITPETPHLDYAAAQGNALARWLLTLPTLAKLNILMYRVIAVGVPLLTIGIITGAWWAKEAWGAYWQWDPKETAALLSWIIYASYLHLNTRRAWRGERCAWISLLGFISIIFCYLGVNIWISGMHSYKL